MTQRLYYTDAYLREFTATVTGVDTARGAVTLDRTALYPTSGGQPHDLGSLVLPDGIVPVVDVVDEDDTVAHIVASSDVSRFIPGLAVHGTVDWTRRFDFMQQHTAQHLLSAMLADAHGWPTTSVHFGDDLCTVDVAAPSIDAEQLASIETAANALVLGNHAVHVTFEDAAHVTGLRKPSDRTGTLRIVEIAGVDRSACGGTHVRHTGEIGALLLRRAERMKGGTRIEFVAGLRAVRRARQEHALLTQSARALSAAPEELPALVASQLARLTDGERERKRLHAELAEFQAGALWAQAPIVDGVRRVRLPAREGAARDDEPLAAALAARGGCVVLAEGRAPAGVLLAASSDSGVDAGQALRAALTAVGGRGGGSPRLAQGSVPDAHAAAQVALALGF